MIFAELFAGDLDALIWIIVVVVSIIAQVFKGKKATGRRRPPPLVPIDEERPRPRPRIPVPEEDDAGQRQIEDFLETLRRMQGLPESQPQEVSPEVPQPPPPLVQYEPPPPPPPVPVRVTEPAPSPIPAPSFAAVKPEAAQPPSNVMVMPSAPRHEDAYALKSRKGPVAIDELRKRLGADLATRDAQQKAFVLTELLGPPLSLRAYGFEPIGLRPLNRRVKPSR